jgi:uncharacterized protein (DUF736 family)
MTQIGSFKSDNGGFAGTIKTLSLNAKAALRPLDSANEKAPAFRLFVGGAECGAAWKKTSRGERDYLSVRIDDPGFPAPVYAALLEGRDGEHRLIWSR